MQSFQRPHWPGWASPSLCRWGKIKVNNMSNQETSSELKKSFTCNFIFFFRKIKYKTGMSPSAAESIRAVFAAFLWHEGLVHDAMTCASFLRFYPELVKDRSVVVRRVHSRLDVEFVLWCVSVQGPICILTNSSFSSKPRNPSQRYSVEVGLTGNAHHLIKPSTMGSLPSVNRSTPPSANANGEPIKVPQVPPMTLEHVSTLWNEISNTCLQVSCELVCFLFEIIFIKIHVWCNLVFSEQDE